MIRWIGLAPWEFEFPFPGSHTSTFLVDEAGPGVVDGAELGASRREKLILSGLNIPVFIPGILRICTGNRVHGRAAKIFFEVMSLIESHNLKDWMRQDLV